MKSFFLFLEKFVFYSVLFVENIECCYELHNRIYKWLYLNATAAIRGFSLRIASIGLASAARRECAQMISSERAISEIPGRIK